MSGARSEYLKYKKIKLNNKHLLTVYMALGGIPYYLNYVEPGCTAEQNIQNILFGKAAPLKDEFDKLFNSLFENGDAYIELVKLIAQRKEGVSRAEIKSTALLSTGGGRLSKRLQDLCETGFIEEYVPWGRESGEFYKLIDEFCLFYLHWVYPNKNKKFTQGHWLSQSQRPSYYAWSGYAFEAICMKHVEQIIKAIGIKSSSHIGGWRFVPRKSNMAGAQIDMVIDRNDNAITLCEVKYTEQPFAIDQPYFQKLKQKMEIFMEVTKTNKQIFLVMISANGLKKNKYSDDIVDGVVILSDLFEEA